MSFINLIIVIENYLTYKYVNLVYLNSVNIFLFTLSITLELKLLKLKQSFKKTTLNKSQYLKKHHLTLRIDCENQWVILGCLV
jgi:hypothetical protein